MLAVTSHLSSYGTRAKSPLSPVVDLSLLLLLLWTPAQRKRASMLYFANVFYLFVFFYGRLILRPWLTEVRESFTRGGP